ncbi:MAG: DMT family transporter [Chloroflexota bacterium]
MSWQLLTALSVLLFSLNGLFHRVLMKEESSDPIAQTIAFYGLGGLFAFVVAIFRGGFHYQISIDQIPFFVLFTAFGTLAPVFGFKALKLIGASENSILSSTTRLWVVLGAFIILHEPFSLAKIIGTIVILVGIGFAQWQKEKLAINKGAIFALIAALSYAITEIIAFYILRNFDVPSFSVYSCILPVILLLIIKPKSISKLSFYFPPRRALNIGLVSINDTISTMLLFLAYQVGHNAAQIGPLMATQTIISVILAIVILKERDNMFNKIIGATIVVFGIILVV